MNQLKVDLGVEEFSLGSGVLRFNPCDPNLYTRFLELADSLEALQKDLQKGVASAPDGTEVLRQLSQADRRFKCLLTQVFGPENDFSRLLQGVNLLALTEEGTTVAENLMAALEPVLTQGAERFVAAQTGAAVEKARQRRENR